MASFETFTGIIIPLSDPDHNAKVLAILKGLAEGATPRTPRGSAYRDILLRAFPTEGAGIVAAIEKHAPGAFKDPPAPAVKISKEAA